MILTLDTYYIPVRIKNRYSLEDEVKGEVNFRPSGAISSVSIKGQAFRFAHEDFRYFQNMANQAKIKLDGEARLDEDCLMAIGQLEGALS
jgi:hypothetical protein